MHVERDRVTWIERGWQPAAIGFCPSAKAWKRLRKLYGDKSALWNNPYIRKDIAGECKYLVNAQGEGMIIVCVDPFKKTAIWTVVHECIHVWQFMQRHMEEPDRPGREIEAYAVEQIIMNVWTAFDAHRKLMKRKK